MGIQEADDLDDEIESIKRQKPQKMQKASNVVQEMVSSWSATSLKDNCLNLLPNISLSYASKKKSTSWLSYSKPTRVLIMNCKNNEKERIRS